MQMLRRYTALALAIASTLLLLPGVGSASAASGTAVSFEWIMNAAPDQTIDVRYRSGLKEIQSNDLVAHRGAASHALFAGRYFLLETAPVFAANRFAGTLNQQLLVDDSELTGVVTVPDDATIVFRNLETGDRIDFGQGTHHFSIPTGVAAHHAKHRRRAS
jgi:hypothetical protein